MRGECGVIKAAKNLASYGMFCGPLQEVIRHKCQGCTDLSDCREGMLITKSPHMKWHKPFVVAFLTLISYGILDMDSSIIRSRSRTSQKTASRMNAVGHGAVTAGYFYIGG